jgi:N-acetylated-alpha-linked acidic dipeptidase
MTEFADPGFHLHVAMGQFVTLLTYHIADDPLIPWDMDHAGPALRDIFEDLEEKLEDRFSDFDVDLGPLDDAVAAFEAAGKQIGILAKQALALNDTVLLGAINAKYRDFSRGFASAGLLPGRFSFYNVVSAPGLDSGYGADVFPAIQDSLDQGNLTQAEEWVERSAKAVLRAAEILSVGK